MFEVEYFAGTAWLRRMESTPIESNTIALTLDTSLILPSVLMDLSYVLLFTTLKRDAIVQVQVCLLTPLNKQKRKNR